MKKILLFALVICLTAFTTKAQDVLLEETFEYSTGLLDNVNTWSTSVTDTYTGEGRVIAEDALSYTDDNDNSYVLSGKGKRLNSDFLGDASASNYISSRSFSDSPITTGNVYISFLYRADTGQSQTASETIGISSRSSNAEVRAWVGKNGSSNDPFKMGVTRYNSGSTAAWATDSLLKVGKTYLVVIKYDVENDIASLWINPELGSTTEPAALCSDNAGTARKATQYLVIRASGRSYAKYNIGGVRVSTSWEKAVEIASKAPQLQAPTTANPSNVEADSFTANWNSVEGAIGYSVKVYTGENIVKTIDITDGSTTSTSVLDIMGGVSYTYTVKAKGNGTTNSDSEDSAPTTAFTTLEGIEEIATDFSHESWGTATQTPSSNINYHDWSANGFNIYGGDLYGLKVLTCPRGEVHQNTIVINKADQSPSIVLPTVKSVKQIEIHAFSGSDNKRFRLLEFKDGAWAELVIFNTSNVDKIFTYTFPVAQPAKLKIENLESSLLQITEITTRITEPVLLETPTVPEASEIVVNSTGFVAQWSSVAGATSYTIFVYKSGNNNIFKTVEVPVGDVIRSTAAETVSYPVDGLASATPYDYRVLAKGDGFDLLADSYLSDIVTITTADITTSIEDEQADAGTVISVKYYNLNGLEILEPSDKGIYIQKALYENGSTKTSKILK